MYNFVSAVTNRIMHLSEDGPAYVHHILRSQLLMGDLKVCVCVCGGGGGGEQDKKSKGDAERVGVRPLRTPPNK